MSRRNLLLFAILCMIWGMTWIGIKVGIEAVPPIFFAGTRFLAAGVLLLVFSAWREGWPRIWSSDWLRLIAVSLLTITVCYATLFWGMVHVDTGTSAVLELSLTPVALMGFAIILGEENFSRRSLIAIALGVTGVIILFGPTAYGTWAQPVKDQVLRLMGAAAIAIASVTYGLGSVLARPLLKAYSAMSMAGITTLFGGLALLSISLAFEPGAITALHGNWGLTAWAGWFFLVIFGSLIGFTIYIKLLAEVGPTRAGTYAFVSPIVAVLLGAAIFGEGIYVSDFLGMLVLLSAAGVAMCKEPRCF